MSINASELFRAMWSTVSLNRPRKSSDVTSPFAGESVEALPGNSFYLRSIDHNIVDCRKLNERWAWANVLHFFSGSEEAEMLEAYNPLAKRFVHDGLWRGAYGAICMPQLRQCADLLRTSPHSRRAIVSLGGYCDEADANRPSCISFMHFLSTTEGLHLHVYQRSLNLWGVMPYDCILLTNILHWMCRQTGQLAGGLTWSIGSLHVPLPLPVPEYSGIRNRGLLIDVPDNPLDVLRKEAARARTFAQTG